MQSSVDKGVSLEEIDKQKIDDLITAKVLKADNLRIRLISNEQFEDLVSKYSEVNVKQLRVDAPEKYSAVLRDWIPFITDAFLNIKIKQWGYTKVFVPETTETYTDYETTYVSVPYYDQNGNLSYSTQQVQVPVEKTRVIPAHYEYFAHAGAEFTLISASGQQKIWMLLDLRDASGDKVPIEMTERILARAMNQFQNLTNRK